MNNLISLTPSPQIAESVHKNYRTLDLHQSQRHVWLHIFFFLSCQHLKNQDIPQENSGSEIHLEQAEETAFPQAMHTYNLLADP